MLALAVALGVGSLWLITGKFVQPIDDTPLNTHVISAGRGTVTLPATDESRQAGVYGLIWKDDSTGERRQGTLGPIVRADANTVSRELAQYGTPPAADAEAKISVTVWAADPRRALGLDYRDVTYPTEYGPMPAWFLPGTKSTWVIQVHGLGAGRSAGLRTLPQLHALGYPVLDITYRNDPGSPHDAGGNRQFGDSEWRDLEAAVRHARAQGAADVVLYGFSMGGGIVETYLHRATDASAVRSAILDSPALDYRAAIDAIASGLGLPTVVGGITATFMELRSGADLDALSENRRAGGPRQPVLLFHGTDDRVVPHSTSVAFARDWPDKVTLVTVEGASHTGAGKADPDTYDKHLAAFLARTV
ncbi:alpha/beta hydrolase [Streptomyces sp. NPDC058297]|uniref:alpha/beta hydrolase n=1 Tax=Streptomyces sp. NPDC058297 TaxID=3346433 RepID=UPI0036EFEAEB